MKRSLYSMLAVFLIAGCSISTTEPSNSSDATRQEGSSQSETALEKDNSDPDTLGDSSVESIPSDDKESSPSSDVASSSSSESPSPSNVESIESSTDGLPFADVEIVPGSKFGFVTANTSRRDLAATVGDARLTDEEFNIGEGFMEPATTVDLGDYSFTVIWDDESRTTPLEIRSLGSAWQLPANIRMGMTFAELQRSLGAFEMFGLGWDYGGTVMLDDTTLDDYRNHLVLRMEPEPGIAESRASDFQAVLGDRLYASTDPHFQALNMHLEEVIVFLEP